MIKIAVRFTIALFFLVLFSAALKAQVVITGKVMDSSTNTPLYPATILNKTTGMAQYADSEGNYRVIAHGGDELHYSYVGFYTGKYTVPQGLSRIIRNIELIPKTQTLSEVQVRALTPYGRDSLDRLNTFKDYLDQPKTRLMDHHSNSAGQGGFGVSFHPITYFSKAERSKRRFQKMFPEFEHDAFIDSRYTPALIQKLTGLTGDSLQTFLVSFRPDYAFTRNASDLEFWSWIKNQYKDWIMPK